MKFRASMCGSTMVVVGCNNYHEVRQVVANHWPRTYKIHKNRRRANRGLKIKKVK